MDAGSRPACGGELVDRGVGFAQAVRGPPGVPDVGELPDEGQRAPRAGAADPDGWMGSLHRQGLHAGLLQRDLAALVVDRFSGEQAGDDLEGVVQQIEALGGRRERDAELVVLLVEPGGAEREFEPAVRGVVDGQRFRCEDGRVPVCHARHQQPEADTRRQAGQRRQSRHSLEGLARPVAVHRLEMVESPGAVEAEIFRQPYPAGELIPREALLGDVESEAHASNLAQRPQPCNGRSNTITVVDFSLTSSERDLVELCREFAQREIAARAPLAWDEGRCDTGLLREMGGLGLLGMLIPEQWGGIGMSTVGFVAALEQIGQADQSVAAALQAHLTIGSLPLLLFGNDAQRERWLRPLAEGRVLGAFGLTEPEAGSDARAIRTRAERRDGGWQINGQKAFISNAGTDMSFGVTVLARTQEVEGKGPRFASFVVEKGTPGFTMGPKMRGIGWRGLDTRMLFFEDVWVPDEHLIGDPDLGLSQFLATLEVGRISIAALSLSLTQAVLDLATEYAQRACNSASRSRSSRRCSSNSPTSPPNWRRRAG